MSIIGVAVLHMCVGGGGGGGGGGEAVSQCVSVWCG